jgi:hypothetical protein
VPEAQATQSNLKNKSREKKAVQGGLGKRRRGASMLPCKNKNKNKIKKNNF